MASDTAQAPMASADPVADAAAAFRSVREPDGPPRDAAGKFARTEPEPETVTEPDEIEAEAEYAEVEVDDEYEVEAEAAEEAQPEPTEMPSSWSKEDAEHWNALPPQAQALIARREGQRETAVNTKFQEAATARKAAEDLQKEAASRRGEYADALDMMMSAIQPVQPDPRAFGYGTNQYNAAGYDLAKAEYDQQAGALAQLKQQRDAIRQQEVQDSSKAFTAWKQEHEAQFAPKLVADVPDLTDPAKADPVLRELVQYAINSGIPAETFAEDQQEAITSAQLHLLWKAKQFDKLQEAKTRVSPKAKTTAPPVRPGVATPRATAQSLALQKDMKRLNSSGSIEDGAAIFKHFRQG